MSPAPSVAANLSPTTRKSIGIEVLARTIPITHLADKPQVSRKFVYQQGEKAQQVLDETFAPSKGDDANVSFTRDQELALPDDSRLGADLSLLLSRRGGESQLTATKLLFPAP